MDAVDGYCARSGQKVFVQYIMLGGVNDELEHAEQLGQLLEGRAVTTVNLIPYNPTGVGVAFTTSKEGTVSQFQMTLRQKYKINTTVRQQMGQDIDGACGQLVISAVASAGGAAADSTGVADIEDMKGPPQQHQQRRGKSGNGPTPVVIPQSAASAGDVEEQRARGAAAVAEFLTRAEAVYSVLRAPAEKALANVPLESVEEVLRAFEQEICKEGQHPGSVRNPTGLLIRAVRSRVWVPKG